jgi:hypothetical protein
MDDQALEPIQPGRLTVPSEMVAEIAAGLEEPKDIAMRYGIAGQAWDDLKNWTPFQNAVAAQKAEYEKSGFTFKVKAKMLTEDVFEDAYKRARSSDATLLQKLEFVKLGAKLADMEPKNTQAAPTGPAFSITINMGDESTKPKTIDITPQYVEKTDENVHEMVDKIENVHEMVEKIVENEAKTG